MVAGGVHGCHRGACMVDRGHVWLLGGMHGSQGVCMVAGGCVWLLGGHAWLLGGMHGKGACMAKGGHAWQKGGGMHGKGRGHVWQKGGMCGEGGVRGIRRDTEIRSMSGRYASYWNAFLLCLLLCEAGPSSCL